MAATITRPPQPCPPGDEVIEEPMQVTIGQDSTEINGDVQRDPAVVRSGTVGPPSVRTRSPPQADGRKGSLARRAFVRTATAAAESSKTARSRGSRTSSPPVRVFLDGHASLTDPESATTPRWIASAAARAAVRVAATVEAGGNLPEEVDHLLDVADKVTGGHVVLMVEQDREALPCRPGMSDRERTRRRGGGFR